MDIRHSNIVDGIALAFNDMTENLDEHHKKLETQTKELFDKNWELQEANSELEASYGQLQAIIEQLNEAEQKYHSLVRNIPEIVCVIDDTGMISFVNHVCADILGYEKSELTGRNILEFIDISSNYISVDEIKAKLDVRNSLTIELSFVRKDGVRVITEANFTNYMYNGISMGLQAIIRDITSKRRMEEKIIQSNRELSIINSVSKSLTSTLDLDHLSSLLVNEITDKLNFDTCSLGLVDNDGTSLSIKAFSGDFYKGFGLHEHKALHLDDEIIAKTFSTEQSHKQSTLPESWLLGKINKLKPEGEKLKEVLFVPFKVKNKNIGMLTVGSKTPIKVSDENLLSYIGNNAAVAIDNALLYETSKKYFIKTIDTLVATVEAKDSYTEGHSRRVSKYAVEIAQKLNMPKDQIEDIKIAGILHDIGKIGISDTILLKNESLTADEYTEVKQHPLISNKILYPVGFSERTLKAIAFHHERFDGKGYPYGLTGNEITIEAQIIAVADAFDAMTSNRSYRVAMDSNEALKELTLNKLTQFNPKIVDSLVDIITTTNTYEN